MSCTLVYVFVYVCMSAYVCVSACMPAAVFVQVRDCVPITWAFSDPTTKYFNNQNPRAKTKRQQRYRSDIFSSRVGSEFYDRP